MMKIVSNLRFLLLVINWPLHIYASPIEPSHTSKTPVPSHSSHQFDYSWADDKGIRRKTAKMIPITKSLKEKDKELLCATIKKLEVFLEKLQTFKNEGGLLEYHDNTSIVERLTVYFCSLFTEIDGSKDAPLSGQLIHACKPMNLHLTHLHYWTISSFEIPEMIKAMVDCVTEGTQQKSPVQAALESFKYILDHGKFNDKYEKNLNNIKLMAPIHKLWNDRYRRQSLEALDKHLQRIHGEEVKDCYEAEMANTQGHKTKDSSAKKISTLEFLRIAGEHLLQLKDDKCVEDVLKKIEGNNFRQKLTHMRKPTETLQTLFDVSEATWDDVYNDLTDFKSCLKELSNSLEEANGDTDCALTEKKYPGLEALHNALSDSQKTKTEPVNILLADERGRRRLDEIAEHLAPYDPDYEDQIKNFQESKNKLIDLKNILYKSITQQNLSKKDKEYNQQRIKEMKNDGFEIIDNLFKKAKQSREKTKETRKSLRNFLKKKYDPTPKNRLEEYIKFYRSFHEKTGFQFTNDTQFWDDDPSFLEVIFAEIRGKPVDTPQSKKQYQLDILNSTLKVFEWAREQLDIAEITLKQEISDFNVSSPAPLDLENYFQGHTSKSSSGLRADKAPVTKKRLEAFLKESPTHIDVLSFLLRMTLEELKTIFYFPHTPNSFLSKLSARNYYSHPDPTRLTPLIIRTDQGGINFRTGNPIYTRPDRGNAYQEVLINEATSIFGVMYYFLKKEQFHQMQISQRYV